jgi:hypothetical protein
VKYAVDDHNQLVALDKLVSPIAVAHTNGNVAQAATGQPQTYEAKWTVEDTRHAKYYTKFIATDVDGNANSITFAWTDACAYLPGGQGTTSTLSANCIVSGVDGLDNGNLTISNAQLTVGSEATWAWNPGKSITLSGTGAIAISGTGQLVKTLLWMKDADNDHYTLETATSTCSGCVRRYTTSTTPGDCNDANANVNPGQAGYFTTAATTNMNLITHVYDGGGEINFDYNCTGAETKSLVYQPGQYYITSRSVLGSCTTAGNCPSCTNGATSSYPGCGVLYTDQGCNDMGVCGAGTPCNGVSTLFQDATGTVDCN